MRRKRQRPNNRKRIGSGFQQLESRLTLSGAGPDVNQDGYITANDALIAINHIGDTVEYGDFYAPDVDGNRRVTARDALIVINDIGKQGQRYFVSVRGIENVVGLTRQEVLGGLIAGFYQFEKTSDINFVFTPPGEDAHFDVTFMPVIIGGQHTRGGYFGGSDVRLHSGQGFAAGVVWSTFHGIKQIFVHEAGHRLGWGHTSDTSCIMHSNASAPEFCASEVAALVRWFGPSKI